MIKIFEIGTTESPYLWKKEATKYGDFVVRDNLPQQVRLDHEYGCDVLWMDSKTHESETGEFVVKETTIALTDEKIRCYPDPKSMNVVIRKAKPLLGNSKMTSIGEVLVIVIIDMNFPMVRYRTNYDIMNTFHNTRNNAEQRYYGCMICVPEEDFGTDKEIIRIQAKDGKSFRFMNICDGKFNTSIIHNYKILKTIKSDWKKKRERGTLFHVSATGNRTSFLIGREKDLPEETLNEIVEKWNDPKNLDDLQVFYVPDNVNPEAPSKDLIETLRTILNTAPKTRAVTIYNHAISVDVLKQFRLLYVFGMETDGTVKVIRSN